jgi:Tol biopolymer transport system component/DNA-directed RNA polymerase specialized sigma24 family protein
MVWAIAIVWIASGGMPEAIFNYPACNWRALDGSIKMHSMVAHSDFEAAAEQSRAEYILQQAREGDEAAVLAFVRAYYADLNHLALTTSPDPSQAEQAVEDTLVGFVRHDSRHAWDSDIRIYLFCILVPQLEARWALFQDAEGDLSAVARLDPQDRWVFLLQAAGTLSAPEIISILGIEAAQYDRHLKRARALLEVEGMDQESIYHYAKQRLSPLNDDARIRNEQRIADDLIALLQEERRRQKKRLVTLEVIWAVLGLSVLFLGYTLFSSIEVAAISSLETPVIDASGPITTQPSPNLPTPTPFPYESTQANGRSHSPGISQDGRYIVFVSEATNLTPDDINTFADIFLYDRVDESISLVTQGLDGLPADGASGGPSISADGRYIAFTSWATNLVPAQKMRCATSADVDRPCADVYLYDRLEDMIFPITQAGEQSGNGDSGVNPWGVSPAEKTAISGDGNVIAFYSRAPNLGADPLHGGLFIYARDGQQLVRVDMPLDGAEINGSSFWPTLSQDGRLLAFTTLASNLVNDDTNNFADIFVFDRVGPVLVRITIGPAGTGASGASVMPALSADGRWLAFRSEAADLVEGDYNETADIFLHDLQAGITRLVSANDQGISGERASSSPAVSTSGTVTAFTSQAGDLVSQITPGGWEVYLFSQFDNSIQHASPALQGQLADGPAASPQVSGDGLFVVYSSAAKNLVEEDVNGFEDIFLFQRESGVIRRINVPVNP